VPSDRRTVQTDRKTIKAETAGKGRIRRRGIRPFPCHFGFDRFSRLLMIGGERNPEGEKTA
jgi:hypothetical protein